MSIVDYRPQPPHLGLDYDQHRFPQPQFTNPWHSSAPGPQGPVYQTSYQHSPTQMEHPQVSRAAPMSMGYTANPAASSLGSDLVPTRSYGSTYASSAPSTQMYAHSSPQRFSPEQVQSASYPYDQDMQRRGSYPHAGSQRASISDEMASARGMVAMANSYDLTPRNGVYSNGISRTSSHDSYGFPAPHSHSSSISSGSAYPYYGNGSYQNSVDGSMTDYSSASEDMVPRTLPAPSAQVVQGFQTDPGAMMSSFNAKMSPNAQKKHKCKICDKRFTRPSSLQTHVYSHTGEKPFKCEYSGCGRHFSVVSNLRRHKKVHKEEGAVVSGDEE